MTKKKLWQIHYFEVSILRRTYKNECKNDGLHAAVQWINEDIS